MASTIQREIDTTRTWINLAWTVEATQPLPIANSLLIQLRLLWFPVFEEYQNQAGESIPVAEGNAIFQISGFPQLTTSLRAKDKNLPAEAEEAEQLSDNKHSNPK